MSGPLSIKIRFNQASTFCVHFLAELISRRSELEGFVELRKSLLGFDAYASKLFRLETTEHPNGGLWAHLALTDAGSELQALLCAKTPDFLAVKDILGRLICSEVVMRAGVDAASGPGEASAPAEPEGGADA
jgi:hypothetical protein